MIYVIAEDREGIFITKKRKSLVYREEINLFIVFGEEKEKKIKRIIRKIGIYRPEWG